MSYNPRMTSSTHIGIVNSVSAPMTLSSGQIAMTSAGGQYTLISQQTASASATIAFTSGLTGYSSYMVAIDNLVASSASTVELVVQMSTNGGSSYQTSSYAATGLAGATSSTNGVTCAYGISTGVGYSTVFLYNITSTYIKVVHSDVSSYYSSTTMNSDFVTGQWSSTSSYNAIQFLFSSGTITSGTFSLYGVN